MNGIKYFSHSSNARSDEKIIALRMQYGIEGYGIYFMLLERLSETDDFTCATDYKALAFDFHCDSDVIKSIVETSQLFALNNDGTRFYSPKFIERQKEQVEKMQYISQKRREAIQKRWAKAREKKHSDVIENQDTQIQMNNTGNTNVSRTKYNSKTTVIQNDTIINKTKNNIDVFPKVNTSLSELDKPNSDDEEIICERTKKIEKINYGLLLVFWNTQTQGIFNSITCIKEKRREAVRARIRQHGKEAFMLAIKRATQSDFLKGQNDRQWKMTFDWLIKPNNFIKVLEGNYDNRTSNIAGDRPAEHHQSVAPNYDETF